MFHLLIQDGSTDTQLPGGLAHIVITRDNGPLNGPSFETAQIQLPGILMHGLTGSLRNEKIPLSQQAGFIEYYSLFQGMHQFLDIPRPTGIPELLPGILAHFQTREKEMGIRKTLGASMKELRYQLSKRFIVWVGLATLLAWPLAYLLLEQWLQCFAYHIQPHPVDFLSAFFLVGLTALGVIFYRVYRTSRVNPAEKLKDE